MEVFVEIEPGLFLGNRIAAKDRPLLKMRRIYGIVNCAHNMENFFEKKQENSPIKEFEYLRLELTEWSPITQEIAKKVEEFVSKYKDARRGVLVHCAAAMQRSPSVIVAYLMKSRKMSLQEAISVVEQKTGGQYYPTLETLESLAAMDKYKKVPFDHVSFFKEKEKVFLGLVHDLGEDVLKKYKEKESQVLSDD